MPELSLPISQGLRFNARGSETEIFLNVNYDEKDGVPTARRNHLSRYSTTSQINRLFYNVDDAAVYSLDVNGDLRRDDAVIDTAYSADGDLILLEPNSDISSRYVFIAGDSKMRKYDGTIVKKWGIDAPTGNAVTLARVSSSQDIVNDALDAGDWTAAACTVAVSDGLEMGLTANTEGSITAAVDNNPADYTERSAFSMRVKIEQPSKITRFSVLFDLTDDAFAGGIARREYSMEYSPSYPPSVDEIVSGTVPQEESGESDSELVDRSMQRTSQLPSTPDSWKFVLVGRDTFTLDGGDWSEVKSIRIIVTSSVNQTIHFSTFYMTPANQDDAQGARYTYAYEDSTTGHHGNLQTTVTQGFIGFNNIVQVTGFAEPPSGQGIDTIRVFRDIGRNGQYFSVGTVAIPDPWDPALEFFDSTPIASLDDLDLNDNGLPPSATLALKFGGSVWLNDTSNKRRVWRSEPGRYESFSLSSGFFNVPELGDELLGWGVIRGQMYCVTRQAIIQVVGATGIPTFRKIVDLGAVAKSALYFATDFLVFVHFSGVYLFDGATAVELLGIAALFEPSTSNSKRINSSNINTCIVGSDDTRIWLTYTQLDTTEVTYMYSRISRRWVQESDILLVHDSEQETYNHIAATLTDVLNLYADSSFAPIVLQTAVEEITATQGLRVTGQDIGLSTPSVQMAHISSLRVDRVSEAIIVTTLYGDVDTVVRAVNLDITADRDVVYATANGDIVERLYVRFATSSGHIELYSGIVEYTLINDRAVFDSGYFAVAGNITGVRDLILSILAVESSDIEVKLTVEDVERSYQLSVIENTARSYRMPLDPPTGRVFRLQLTGGRFQLLAAHLGIIRFGSAEVEYVAISVGT